MTLDDSTNDKSTFDKNYLQLSVTPLGKFLLLGY